MKYFRCLNISCYSPFFGNNQLFCISGRNLSLIECAILSSELRANGFKILKREVRPAIAGGGF